MASEEMLYRVLADITVAIHFTYVAFVVAVVPLTLIGGFLGWSWVRNRWLRGIHLAMIGVVVAEAWVGITCPLTIWEKQLRAAAGEQSYQGDFLATWLHDLMFFEADPWVFTCAYSLFGVLVVCMFIWVPVRRKNESD